MNINDVLFFDTETTGIPDRSAKWDVDFNEYPRIVQIAWMIGEHAESHIIRPDGWEIPDDTVEIHGITTEYAMEHGDRSCPSLPGSLTLQRTPGCYAVTTSISTRAL